MNQPNPADLRKALEQIPKSELAAMGLIVELPPVHPKCRVFDNLKAETYAYCEKLRKAENHVALNQLAEALKVFATRQFQDQPSMRRN